jgi:hypothetical protein
MSSLLNCNICHFPNTSSTNGTCMNVFPTSTCSSQHTYCTDCCQKLQQSVSEMKVYGEQQKACPSPICSICTLPFGKKRMISNLLECGHMFHVKCIKSWVHSNATCPLCEESVSLCDYASLFYEERNMSKEAYLNYIEKRKNFLSFKIIVNNYIQEMNEEKLDLLRNTISDLAYEAEKLGVKSMSQDSTKAFSVNSNRGFFSRVFQIVKLNDEVSRRHDFQNERSKQNSQYQKELDMIEVFFKHLKNNKENTHLCLREILGLHEISKNTQNKKRKWK